MKINVTMVPDGIGPPYTSSYGYLPSEEKFYQLTRNGKLIEYSGFPAPMYLGFTNSSDKAKYMRERVVGKFPHRIVPMEEVDDAIDENGIYINQ